MPVLAAIESAIVTLLLSDSILHIILPLPFVVAFVNEGKLAITVILAIQELSFIEFSIFHA